MKKIHFYGDSTTFGQTKLPDGTNGVSFWNVPDVVLRLLEKKFGTGSVQVSNKGVSGSRIEQWVNGDAAAGMPNLASRLTSYDSPDIVVFEIGLNNATQPDYSHETFCTYLQNFANQCKLNNKTLILCTPNPANDLRAANLDDIQRSIRAFSVWFKVPLIDHFAILTNYFPNWRDLLSDVAHPGDTMYCTKGATTAGFLGAYI